MIGIIPAAGKGLRFKELGKQYNKCILPYKDKPLLIHQIEYLKGAGCEEIIVVVNHRIDTIKDILEFYNQDVKVVIQKETNGLSGAIFTAIDDPKYRKQDTLIHLGDVIFNKSVFDFRSNFISVKKVEDYSRWCMAKFENKRCTFIDKPEDKPDTEFAVSGLYFVKANNKLHNKLEKQLSDDSTKISGEFQFSTVLQQIANDEIIKYIELGIKDFGTLEEFISNKGLSDSREFNNIKIFDDMIWKESNGVSGKKLINEYNWFSSLPNDIKIHTPQILSNNILIPNQINYCMEKLNYPTLKEIFLFLDKSTETWEAIFNSIFNLLDKLESYKYDGDDFLQNILTKTYERIYKIPLPIHNVLVNDFMNNFTDVTNNIIDKKLDRGCMMHGDFCFSNLFYDFQFSKIYMIDPRGEMFGSHWYEMAKLFHSVFCSYDIIDSELYVVNNKELKLYNDGNDNVVDVFSKMIGERYSEEEIEYIWYITASLFLSMIPLHSHNINNQKLYYKTFVSIYTQLESGEYKCSKQMKLY